MFVHGCLDDRDQEIRTLRVLAGDRGARVEARRGDSEWWAIVPIGRIAEPRSLRFRLEAELRSGETTTTDVGVVGLEPELPLVAEPVPDRWPGETENRVAICMGTHEPPPELFRQQIESIRAQTHREWICVISDDASRPESLEVMREIIAGDERFALRPSEGRLGFYSNFERALRLAPSSATHIALSDHDDRWRPDRLETLLSALGDRHTLAYSDMRIVSSSGEVISNTYWRYRRNNWTDLARLLIGNTITGGASLFQRSLLDRALPFPPRMGNAFHDHWLALVALASGSVAYVDRTLYDYVQHRGTVIGFSSANADRAEGVRGVAALGVRLADRVIHPEGRRRYFEDYCRIALLASALELRCGDLMTAEKRDAAREIRSLDDSAGAAARLALHSLAPGNETMGVDRSVLAGLVWSRLARRRANR